MPTLPPATAPNAPPNPERPAYAALAHNDTIAQEALRLASKALDAAESQHQPFAMSQALVGLARAYGALAEWPAAEACLQQALRWTAATGSTDHRVDVLCERSECAVQAAEWYRAAEDSAAARAARQRARDAAFQASRLAAHVADPTWEATVLLRISDVLDRCGDRHDAVMLQTRALRLMSGQATSSPVEPNTMPSLGRLADA